ncbi:MAG: class I SAM-dependent methyltransferase [Candidatus Rhabdochlamydia sp.]
MKYQLLDSGFEQKLEQFGPYVISRPCSQAVWAPTLPKGEWRATDASFTRDPANRWSGRERLPASWNVEHEGVKFKLEPTDFGHLGMFPEHAELWRWLRPRVGVGSKCLNLFAYTGGVTFAAAQMGASVCHVDASKTAVAWARQNCALNQLEHAPIRWIVDDVVKFLLREVKRKSLYHGIILDPPTFGRGNRGEVFKIDTHLIEILNLCSQLLAEGPSFLILSSHTPGYTPIVLHHLLHQCTQSKQGVIEAAELLIPGPLSLPSGTYARWYAQ